MQVDMKYLTFATLSLNKVKWNLPNDDQQNEQSLKTGFIQKFSKSLLKKMLNFNPDQYHWSNLQTHWKTNNFKWCKVIQSFYTAIYVRKAQEVQFMDFKRVVACLNSVGMEFKTEMFSRVSLYSTKERIYQSKVPDAFAQHVSYCVKVLIYSVLSSNLSSFDRMCCLQSYGRAMCKWAVYHRRFENKWLSNPLILNNIKYTNIKSFC